MHWLQNYDPLHNAALSTLVAALPIVVLLGAIAIFRVRAHYAALTGMGIALVIAWLVYRMPIVTGIATVLYGAAYGLFPIGWIILNLIFLYQLTVEKGLFVTLRNSLAAVTPDPRIQVILIAFCFGAFFEGAAGFGTPVAVTAAILIQLGFRPLAASGLSLIANTAPVAFGALGTPIIVLSGVTGLDQQKLSAMVGRQLPFFSVLVPFWVVWAMVGFRGMLGVWPAALTAGLAFAIPQFVISNYHGPWLVDVGASLVSMGALVILLRFWRPAFVWSDAGKRDSAITASVKIPRDRREVWQAWMPWVLLSVFVFLWGVPHVRTLLDHLQEHLHQIRIAVPKLHGVVVPTPPVAPPGATPEKAIYSLNVFSATGTGILLAALVAGGFMKYSFREIFSVYWKTLVRVRFSLLTIAGMLALGFVTRYSGTDATLGLAMAATGCCYPFFGTLLGWLGVALTGSDTSSNVLFGGLQKITAQQVGVDPTLMAAANSSGGVMGKMVDAQSIVVASTATNWYGHESDILRYVFFHSIALAALVGMLVMLQAYVAPFSSLVVK
jgi:lactate permease